MPCTLPLCCRRHASAIAAIACLLASGAARAAVADYSVERLVMEGDPDPVSGTIGTIFGDVSIDGAGRVALWGNSNGDARLFSVEGGALAIAVAAGDTASGTGGAALTDVGRPRIATPDALAYVGVYSGVFGGFLRSGGAGSALALPGDAAPGGGTLTAVLHIHSAAPGPWVAFGAQVDPGGPVVAAHFARGPGGLREIYREGQATPAGVGGVFSGVDTFDEAGIADDGSVAFASEITGGSSASGLFRAPTAGAITPLLLEGDAVATPGGGTFEFLAPFVSVNDAGDVAFVAAVLRAPIGFPREAVFVLEAVGLREIAIRGDAIPGASAAAPFFQGLAGSAPPEVGGTGVVAFAATLADAGETTSRRALVVDDGGDLGVLLEEGDSVPGVPGAEFSDFNEVRVDAAGRIAINAITTQGTGVFLATRSPEIPALPPTALAALAALVAGFSYRRVARRQPGRTR